MISPTLAATLVTGSLALILLSLAARAAARSWERQKRRAILDAGDGPVLGNWREEDGKLVVTTRKGEHHFDAGTGTELVVDGPRGLERWRMVVTGRMGNLEVPLRRLLELPRAGLEDLADRCIAWLPTRPGGPKSPTISRAALHEYARQRGFHAETVEAALCEVLKAIRGGEADTFLERGWRKFVLNYKEALGFAAVGLIVVGVVLGIQLMTDPYFYAFFTRQESQWVLALAVALSVLGVTWGANR